MILTRAVEEFNRTHILLSVVFTTVYSWVVLCSKEDTFLKMMIRKVSFCVMVINLKEYGGNHDE